MAIAHDRAESVFAAAAPVAPPPNAAPHGQAPAGWTSDHIKDMAVAYSGKFGPDALLVGMAEALTDPAAKVESLHLFTFNQVAATVVWQDRMLAELA